MSDRQTPPTAPFLVHLRGWRARLFERLWSWAGAAAAWIVVMASFAAACLAWFGLHALVRRWVPVPKLLAHPMVMLGVLTMVAIPNIDRLRRPLDWLSNVVDSWIPTLITLSEGEFALGRYGEHTMELRIPGTYLLRAGMKIEFKGTQDEHDHFDPMSL